MNNTQYTKYLFDKVRDISKANPGVIRDTYGDGENLTHKFLIKELKNGNRTLKSAQAGSREIQAFCKVIKDRNLIREWLTELEVLFKNYETIPPHKKSPKAVPDPRVITIREQLENLN